MNLKFKVRGVLVTVLTASMVMVSEDSITRELTESRAEVENRLDNLVSTYRVTPKDLNARRAYADTLFKLGNIWQANEVAAPLITARSPSPWDLELVAHIALLMMDLKRAESLYTRLIGVSSEGSDSHTEGLKGLLMVYYQSQDFEKAKHLSFTSDDSSLLRYLKAFEGRPYQMRWTSEDKVAHLPFTNDITRPGALPEVEITVNGEATLLTLDTGGDRLYLDTSVAKKVGIRELTSSQAKYAYTGGKLVQEPLGVADRIELGGVVLANVPTVVARWKAHGPKTDGVLGTAILKQFLSTIDYEKAEITLRPRNNKDYLRDALGERETVNVPFFMSSTHLMFAKGQINNHAQLNLFLDSGLAASMPMIVVDETVELLGLTKNELDGLPYYWVPLSNHGLNGLLFGATQALGNVFVESDIHRSQGFFLDALISHQYLWKLGSWTIDFDTMSYYFPMRLDSIGPTDPTS